MDTVGLVCMLSACSIEDFKSKKVYTLVVYTFAVLGVIYHIFAGSLSTLDMLGGLSIGLILYIVSCLTDEKIGKGDAMVMGACGIYLGFIQNILLLLIASTLAGIYGFVLCCIKRTKNVELAFVPFVLAGFVCIKILGRL